MRIISIVSEQLIKRTVCTGTIVEKNSLIAIRWTIKAVNIVPSIENNKHIALTFK